MTLFFLLSEEAQLAICIVIARKCGRPERQRTKLEILSEQQNHRCCYCGIRFVDPPYGANLKKRHWKRHLDGHPHMASIEHVVRLIDGGQRVWENEVAACADCNQRRQHVDAYSFYTYRAAILSNIKRRRRQRQKERRRAKQAALAKSQSVKSRIGAQHQIDEHGTQNQNNQRAGQAPPPALPTGIQDNQLAH